MNPTLLARLIALRAEAQEITTELRQDADVPDDMILAARAIQYAAEDALTLAAASFGFDLPAVPGR